MHVHPAVHACASSCACMYTIIIVKHLCMHVHSIVNTCSWSLLHVFTIIIVYMCIRLYMHVHALYSEHMHLVITECVHYDLL